MNALINKNLANNSGRFNGFGGYFYFYFTTPVCSWRDEG